MVTLSKSEIRALYGFKANEEVVAFGRSIKHTTGAKRNKRPSIEELYKYRPAKAPQAAVIESDVQEQI